jgi:hypothetical protein
MPELYNVFIETNGGCYAATLNPYAKHVECAEKRSTRPNLVKPLHALFQRGAMIVLIQPLYFFTSGDVARLMVHRVS